MEDKQAELEGATIKVGGQRLRNCPEQTDGLDAGHGGTTQYVSSPYDDEVP